MTEGQFRNQPKLIDKQFGIRSPKEDKCPHTLVQQLIGVVDRKETVGQPTSLELLDIFWDEVAKLGTPLIEETARGMRATFLFRESVEHMITVDAYTGVWVEWRQAYAGGHRVALQRLERTDVWWAEIEIPQDFTGMYTYVIANQDGIITEDIHEPWPMSFNDEFNPRGTTDVDMAYPSNLLMTKASTTGSAGSISTVLVPAERLPLPPRTWRRGTETRTEPHPEGLPGVVLHAKPLCMGNVCDHPSIDRSDGWSIP